MKHCLGLKKFCKILRQINSSYFSKMVLHNNRNKTIGLQYEHGEPENFDVNKVCFP